MWEWAEAHRRMGKEVTARPGRYTLANGPFQRDPQDAFIDPSVQTTVLWWASRLGKTEMLLNLEGWVIDTNPMGILIVYPTLASSEKWSKEFFAPMVASTPKLRDKIREPRSRDSNNTILSKQFPGGKISAIGSNSPSGFRQIQAPVVLCDEIDAMETTKEGDPITLAMKRADNYSDSIQVLSSTGTIKGISRIENWYLRSDQQKWHCPCPKCGVFQVLQWCQIKFTFLSDDGKEIKTPESAVLVCSACKAELDDRDRVQMVLRGEWRATAPFNGIRGYWLNGINSVFPAKKGYASKLHQMAQDFIDANSAGGAALQVWTNTFLAEVSDEKGESVDPLPIIERCEPYGHSVPNAVLVLTCGVDVQGDRLEAEVVGHGRSEETWGIEFKQFFGNPHQQSVWNALDEWLSGEFTREDGTRMKIAITCIDTGDGKSQKPAYAFIKPRQARKVFACKGSSTPNAALVRRSQPNKKNPHSQRVHLFIIGTDTAKSTIYSRLQLTDHGPRFAHYPEGCGYDEEYFRQLTAEEIKTEYYHGFPRRVWVKTRPRNEALDIRVLNLAAFEILNPRLDEIAKMFSTQAEKPEAVKPEREYVLKPRETEPEPVIRDMRRQNISRVTGVKRGGWVGGWKK